MFLIERALRVLCDDGTQAAVLPEQTKYNVVYYLLSDSTDVLNYNVYFKLLLFVFVDMFFVFNCSNISFCLFK